MGACINLYCFLHFDRIHGVFCVPLLRSSFPMRRGYRVVSTPDKVSDSSPCSSARSLNSFSPSPSPLPFHAGAGSASPSLETQKKRLPPQLPRRVAPPPRMSKSASFAAPPGPPMLAEPSPRMSKSFDRSSGSFSGVSSPRMALPVQKPILPSAKKPPALVESDSGTNLSSTSMPKRSNSTKRFPEGTSPMSSPRGGSLDRPQGNSQDRPLSRSSSLGRPASSSTDRPNGGTSGRPNSRSGTSGRPVSNSGIIDQSGNSSGGRSSGRSSSMGQSPNSSMTPSVRPQTRESSRERPLSRSMDRPGNSGGGKPNNRSGSNGRTATPIMARPVKKMSPSASHKIPGQSPRISQRRPSTEQSLELSLGAVPEQEQSSAESAVPPPPPLEGFPPLPLPSSTVAERARLNSYELAQWAMTRACDAAAAAQAAGVQNKEEDGGAETHDNVADALREVEEGIDEDYEARDAMPPTDSMPPPPPLTESPSNALTLSTPKSFRTRMATMRANCESSGTNTISCASFCESVQTPSEDIASPLNKPLAISDLVEPSRHGEMLYVPNQDSPNVQFVGEVAEKGMGVEESKCADTIRISDLAETMEAMEKQMANSAVGKVIQP